LIGSAAQQAHRPTTGPYPGAAREDDMAAVVIHRAPRHPEDAGGNQGRRTPLIGRSGTGGRRPPTGTDRPDLDLSGPISTTDTATFSSVAQGLYQTGEFLRSTRDDSAIVVLVGNTGIDVMHQRTAEMWLVAGMNSAG
jgi:hypothetical protein